MWKAPAGFHHLILYLLVFLLCFVFSAAVRIKTLGSAPQKLLRSEYDGEVIRDLSCGKHACDLFLPEEADPHHLILFIHGGSFNSGSKEDMEAWCRYYAHQGYVTASADYSLQNHGQPAALPMMEQELEEAVRAIQKETEQRGIRIKDMAVSGVSAGGTLAMNLAFHGSTVIPVRFVFQLAAPAWFDPEDWGLLKKVDHLDSDEAFVEMMTGSGDGDWKAVSPAFLCGNNPVPVLLGYGLTDHCVPLDQKEILMESFEKNHVPYEYLPFTKSNHGMYNDLDIMQEYLEKSLEYCRTYFKD